LDECAPWHSGHDSQLHTVHGAERISDGLAQRGLRQLALLVRGDRIASGRMANGRLLCYSFQLNPSVVIVMPTSAASGGAADRGRTVGTGGSVRPVSEDLLRRHLLDSLKPARLDLATGNVTFLPSAWIGCLGAVITW
jgi:hypothetical protein